MSLTPIVLTNATDAFVLENRPSENYDDTIRLRLNATTSYHAYSFLHFPRPFPFGVTVTSAVLRVYVSGSWSAVSRTLTLKRVTGGWKQGTLNYNNMPGVASGTGLADQQTWTSSSAKSDGDYIDFDVTTMMQAVSTSGTAWYGFRLASNEATERKLYSANAANNPPTLSITWSEAPSAPTVLSPSGSRYTALAKPMLRFDFTDVAGSTQLQAVNVQINHTNSWGAPTFDSGTVTTSDAQLDLTGTAYAGLTDGSYDYWRVRVQDAAGLWSGWSDAALMYRASKGTLAITNPAASPNNYVNEPTPPITWTYTLTAHTTKAYQVIITDSTGEEWLFTTGKISYASPVTSGTTQSYTLPSKVLHDNTTYQVVIRIWDDYLREATPGDTAFVSAARSFDMRQGATTVITGFTGTDQTPVPAMQLDWSRATQPDRWAIYRGADASHLRQILTCPGADLFVSGTAYRYTDYTAPPRTSQVWEVRAVVGSTQSQSNPQVTATISPIGIWLSDMERGVRVQLAGDEPGDWTMGEDAAVYTVVGASKAVRITQSLRGWEGSIQGTLIDRSGRTQTQVEADLMDLKSRPRRTYQLSLSNVSFPVVIGNVVMAPTPLAGLTVKQVSFEFWQVGDLSFEAHL